MIIGPSVRKNLCSPSSYLVLHQENSFMSCSGLVWFSGLVYFTGLVFTLCKYIFYGFQFMGKLTAAIL